MVEYEYRIFDVADQDIKIKTMVIPTERLIRPEDLHNYVGQVLEFHNGYGYIVTAVLLDGDVDPFDEYSFGPRNSSMDYSHELDMAWMYCPNDELQEYMTLQYAYVLIVDEITHDELMNIKYVAKPSEESLAFREKILSMDKEYLAARYKELKKKFD